MARDNALHQNVSPAHAVAYLSISPYSRVAADGLSPIAITYIVSAYRAAACSPSAISARKAGASTRARSWILPQRGPHRRWADRHVDTVAVARA
jgi:hypothetical protein